MITDTLTPLTDVRWLITITLMIAYIIRICYFQVSDCRFDLIFLKEFYVVTYALSVVQLNLFILFMTPIDEDGNGSECIY